MTFTPMRIDCPHILMLQVKLGKNLEALTVSEKYTLIAVFALYLRSPIGGDLIRFADDHKIYTTDKVRWVLEALDDSPDVDSDDLLDFILDFTMHITEGIHA